MAPRIVRSTPRNTAHRRNPRVAGSESPVPALVLHLNYGVPRRGLPAAQSFRRWVSAALAVAGHGGAVELSIRLVGAREGRALNRRYRGRDYATNVLSFPVELPDGFTTPLLGDIALCAPVLAGEARAQGKTLRQHAAHLTIHGVLHLLGHDHQHARETAAMEALETDALALLRLPDPYTYG